MYNGNRRDGRRNIEVPLELDSKTNTIDNYIWKNLSTNMHET